MPVTVTSSQFSLSLLLFLHVLWLKLLNLLISHPSSDLCNGSRLMNALNINSSHSPYKVLTTSQPDYLHNHISVQSTSRTRSSSAVTLTRPSVSSSLQITNRSFRYASPYLWNQLPSSFRQPHSVHCPPGSPHPAHISHLITVTTFTLTICHSHSLSLQKKTHLFHKSFPPSSSDSFRTAFTDLNLY